MGVGYTKRNFIYLSMTLKVVIVKVYEKPDTQRDENNDPSHTGSQKEINHNPNQIK